MLLSAGMGAANFRELIAWQLARELRRALRPLWHKAQMACDYNLCDQLRNSARSTTANIAEGFPCSHVEFARFLEISARSLEEIEDRLIEMVDGQLVTDAEVQPAIRLKIRTARAVAGLRAYLLSTPDPSTYKPRRAPRRT